MTTNAYDSFSTYILGLTLFFFLCVCVCVCRYEVVMAIVSTAKRDLSIVADSEDLLDFVKERTLDKKVGVLT